MLKQQQQEHKQPPNVTASAPGSSSNTIHSIMNNPNNPNNRSSLETRKQRMRALTSLRNSLRHDDNNNNNGSFDASLSSMGVSTRSLLEQLPDDNPQDITNTDNTTTTNSRVHCTLYNQNAALFQSTDWGDMDSVYLHLSNSQLLNNLDLDGLEWEDTDVSDSSATADEEETQLLQDLFSWIQRLRTPTTQSTPLQEI